MHKKKLVPGARLGATGAEVVAMHAVARLMLGASIPNIQASWVKEGPKMAQHLLSCGANDMGGTLINESISTSAGASFGQLVPPRELRRLIRDAGRVPAERTSTYAIRRVFEKEPDEGEASPLDQVTDPEARFGSYRRLTLAPDFRFRRAPDPGRGET
jgi:FO synthase subunit 2